MMSLTMQTVIMMVEIAAFTSTQITALIAYVIIRKIVLLGLLPLLLETVSVMTTPTMLTVTLMVEIAALTSTQITALIAYVIIRKIVLLGFYQLLLEMVTVTMVPTMLIVTMMGETVSIAFMYYLCNGPKNSLFYQI